ncbi:hypothetical protein Barb4_00145 [Bacteroidales bacterium Barb4]|nr:hypothetical protein Barb4_00145 [Bacteroidales bacterium Barb4]
MISQIPRCPEGAKDFSPTCSVAECGVIRQVHINKVLKNDTNQDFFTGITINPTFRYAACGAEIFCPFGASA